MRSRAFLLAALFASAALSLLAAPGRGQTSPASKSGNEVPQQDPEAQKQRLRWADLEGGGRRVSFAAQEPRWRWAHDGIHLEKREGRDVVWIDPESFARRKPEPAPAEARTARPRIQGARFVELAPGGQWVSFVRDRNVFVRRHPAGPEWQVTQNGGPGRLNGELDWVYQEEVYGRGKWQASWWRGDGHALAFLTLDVQKVPTYPVMHFLGDSPRVETTSFPKPGEPNPTADLRIAVPEQQKLLEVDLGAFGPEKLIVRVFWEPGGARRLFAMVQDHIQQQLTLVAVDVATGKLERLIEERSQSWVPIPELPRFLRSGDFLWHSVRTGYEHLYRYAPDGTLKNAVTQGEWELRDIELVDEERGVLWFTSNAGSAAGRQLARVGLDGQGYVQVTSGRGWHDAEPRPDGRYVLDRHESLEDPGRTRLLGPGGEELRVLSKAAVPALATHVYSVPQRHVFQARDGLELEATVILPPEREPGVRAPILLPTYSGPAAPSVRDRWSPSVWHQFLAQQGLIVLQVNVRSASTASHAQTSSCYGRLGEQELADLEDAVDFCVQEFEGDPLRVGIQGWSYGGTMAAMALTHSKKFRLGLAGAGVYDWRLYDTIYTERYMGLPSVNAQGYDRTSVIRNAKNVEGHLVLMHGLIDDNVHAENTLKLADALQRFDKDFTLMLYPGSRHGVAWTKRAHKQSLEWRMIQRYLLGS